MSTKLTKEIIQERAGSDILILGDYIYSKTRILCECNKCKNQWRALPNKIGISAQCPKCIKRGVENIILENNGDWLKIDISTPTHPTATMDVDTDVFRKHKGGRIFAWKKPASSYIYAVYNINKIRKLFHHDVVEQKEGFETGHNQHGSMSYINNRRSNLELVTSSQNKMNIGIRSNNNSGITGVCWDKIDKKWLARICVNGKEKHLGYFDNIEIAIGVRQQAEKELFGEYRYSANN